MATPISNKFTSFSFSQEELFAATRFSPHLLMLLQTLYSEVAQERLNMTVDHAKPMEFIQIEACLKGKMEAFDYLITLALDTPAPSVNDGSKSAEIVLNPKV